MRQPGNACAVFLFSPVTLTQQGYWDPDQPLVGAWALNEQYLALVKEGGKSTNGIFYKGIEIWDLMTGRKVSTLDLENQMVQNLIWASESGKLAVSGDKLCQIWDAPAGKKLHVFPTHSARHCFCSWWSSRCLLN
jgi:WD40 repeat protein